MTVPPPSSDDLFGRTSVADEVALLRPDYPRSVWPGHPNLGDTARFWLQRHAMFRTFGAELTGVAETFRADPVNPAIFRAWIFPRLQSYLSELHGHHHVEDAHYFPVFRTADPRLGRGFDILDADHHAIDAVIHGLAEAANSFDEAIRTQRDVRPGGDALVGELTRLMSGVGRHLDDEEDIVMPLILARTERGLGIAGGAA